MTCTSDNKADCYVPPPSIGHELGIMFGFLGLMLVCMLAYALVWNLGNARALRKERERVEALRASGHLPAEKKVVEEGGAAEAAA